MRTFRSTFWLAAITLAVPISVFAADTATSLDINLNLLTRLYQTQIRIGAGKDASIERQIANERSRIRSESDDQINNLINAMTREGTGSTVGLNAVVTQQKDIISALSARRESVQQDLNVLEEEEKLYTNSQTASGAVVTSSLPELYAKRAALQEQTSSLDFFLKLEGDRLTRLQWQQRLQQFSLLITILRYVLIAILIVAFERLMRQRVFFRIKNTSTRYIATKFFTAFVYIAAIIWLILSLSSQYPQILTSLAILGAGVALSLQDVLKDIVGSIMIVQRRLFTLGQRISVGPYTGDVIDIGLLRTTIIEVANANTQDVARVGKTLAVPNSMFLNQPVLNYHTTSDYVSGELVITITYDSDWKKAKDILQEILRNETEQFIERAKNQQVWRLKQYFSSHEPQGAHVFMEPVLRGIRFTLRFPFPVGQRRPFITKLSEMIFEKFAEEKTIRVAVEGENSAAFGVSESVN